jgi:hypothetical protein
MNTLPPETIKRMTALHVDLGEKYRAVCARYGALHAAPTVGWVTPYPYTVTVAHILWDDGTQEVSGFPVDMLPHRVARIVVDRLGSGN